MFCFRRLRSDVFGKSGENFFCDSSQKAMWATSEIRLKPGGHFFHVKKQKVYSSPQPYENEIQKMPRRRQRSKFLIFFSQMQ